MNEFIDMLSFFPFSLQMHAEVSSEKLHPVFGSVLVIPQLFSIKGSAHNFLLAEVCKYIKT